MKTLITGSSGFLGSYLVEKFSKNDLIELNKFKVKDEDIVCDLANQIPDFSKLEINKVIHNAGLAHRIPKTKEESDLFFQVNHIGTKNLLNGLLTLKTLPNSIILISTVAVYGLDMAENISENHPLFATDPYGKSKILAENEILSFCKLHNISYLILRLPLVIGQNPLGNLQKMILGIESGKYARIGTGSAKKSMVYAKDVAYLVNEYDGLVSGIFNLTDGYNPSFSELENEIGRKLNKSIKVIPNQLAKFMAVLGTVISNTLIKNFPLTNRSYQKITNSLFFNDEKAKLELNWKPTPVLSIIKDIL